MTALLSDTPYQNFDESALLAELNTLTQHHLNSCDYYANIWPQWQPAQTLAELPYLHVGIFKHLQLKSISDEIKHSRTLASSATTSGVSSIITLDKKSSELQSKSSLAILKDFVGDKQRPLIILDSAASLRGRGNIKARIAAAMSLQPLSSQTHFLLKDAEDTNSTDWNQLEEVLDEHDSILVYGFTWVLWKVWGNGNIPASIKEKLANKTIHFVHSGGWKKLEAESVSRETFDNALLDAVNKSSKVVDYYGLVEQVGIIYPQCEHGSRHVPRWAAVMARDPWTLEPTEKEGVLQLMNSLALGAPYHSVLTEDLGRILPGKCPCGREGFRFELLGRVPKAEVRGCANV